MENVEKVESPVVGESAPDVIEVDKELRTDLVLALMRRRAAQAELALGAAKVERLIEKLDKDGELAAAIKNANALMAQANEVELRCNAIISKVQQAAGHSIAGYAIDQNSGILRKPPETQKA